MLEIGNVQILPEFGPFIAFALAGLALNLVPGADMTFVIASSARDGIRSGLAAAFGIGAGALVHIAAAVVGLSAVIAASETAFVILKWVGAAYLAFIAFGMLRRPSPDLGAASPSAATDVATFRTGALVNILNPKVGLFFIAFLPQFVDPEATMPALQILVLGLWFNLVGTIVNCLVALVAAKAARQVRNLRWAGTAARWLGATAMGGMAVHLLVSQRR